VSRTVGSCDNERLCYNHTMDTKIVVLDDGRTVYENDGGGQRDTANGRIVRPGGGWGIAPGDSMRARELQAIRRDGWRQAALAGALRAAEELGLDHVPTAAVEAVTAALVKRAINGNDRAANEAARLFFQVVGLLGGRADIQDDDGGELSITARFNGPAAVDLLAAIAAARQRLGNDAPTTEA